MKKITFRDFISQRKTFGYQWETVSAVLRLSTEGLSVPFIATYRRDQTGGLKGSQIREILRTQRDYEDFLRERLKVVKKIQSQKGVDRELIDQMESCKNSGELDDLQKIYNIQKKTKALLAEQAGLLPLARWILDQGRSQDHRRPVQNRNHQGQGQKGQSQESGNQEGESHGRALERLYNKGQSQEGGNQEDKSQEGGSQKDKSQGGGSQKDENQVSDQVSLETKAKEFINQRAGLVTYQEILGAVKKVIVKKMVARPNLYREVRESFLKEGVLRSRAGKKSASNSKYQRFFNYEHKLEFLFSSNSGDDYLTLYRGWKEGELTVSMENPGGEGFLKKIKSLFCPNEKSLSKEFLDSASEMAFKLYMIPSLQDEIHERLGKRAEDRVIRRSCKRLKKLLLTPSLHPPFSSEKEKTLSRNDQNKKTDSPATKEKDRGAETFGLESGPILGAYPCGKNICQLALIDERGRFISGTILKIGDEEALSRAVDLFSQLLKQIQIQAVSVARTGGFREAEGFIRKLFQTHLTKKRVPVTLVDGVVAKLYGNSETGVLEFPDEKSSVRSAIFTARYLQDPLFELVKVDCSDLDLDPHQKEVSQDRFKESLSSVVEDCVHFVGVDVNRASSSLLDKVSGISRELAVRIVEERENKGFFKTREDLGHLSGWTSQSYKQALGFLRVFEGPGLLDKTGIHPETYRALRDMARELDRNLSSFFSDGADQLLALKQKWSGLVGECVFDFIYRELKSCGRDPRGKLKIFQFRKDLFSLGDLKEGMICDGLVSNLAPFGFFVNIGIPVDGLVHHSDLPPSLRKNFREKLGPGDQMSVKVKSIDHEKGQFNLTMKFGDQVKDFGQKGREQKAGRTLKRAGRLFKKQRDGGLGKEGQTGNRNLNHGFKKEELRGELKSGKKGKNKKGNRPKRGYKSGGGPRSKTPFNNPFQVLQNLKK